MGWWWRGVCLALLLLFAPAARAQCEGTWDSARIGKILDQVGEQLAQADLNGAKAGLGDLDKGWPCIEDLASKALLARYARSVGLLRFYEQDEPQAIKWGLLARHLDPGGPWPGELPEGHPYLALLDEEEDPAVERAEGWLVPPEKGAIFVNAEFAAEPHAPSGVPVFVQHFDRAGFPIRNYWQDGAAFLPEVLSAEGGPVEPPKYYNPETGAVKVAKAPAKVKVEKIKIEKAPSDFPVIPVATAGGLAALSGLSYALASAVQGSMASAETPQQLTRARSTTNVLVMVSAATGAGAAGVGLGTVLLDGRSLVWTVRF